MASRELSELSVKLENRTAVIGVVDLGYVGIPLLLRFSEVGFRVLGFDIDPGKVVKLGCPCSRRSARRVST